MKIKDKIFDHRINSLNLLLETNIGEYYELSNKILSKNEFQRRRVKSSSTVYSLLKTDLKTGCVIPPIVLALAIEPTQSKSLSDQELLWIIEENKSKLIILDGLQRTFTIRDLVNELKYSGDNELGDVLTRQLRIEIYVGINKLGILYRMLTLNTGQTPMSSRHQIEIIYSDYIQNGLNDIRLIKEVEEDTPAKFGEYKFRDIIEGFTSFLERDYLTIDRNDILDNIKSLEKLAIKNQGNELFEDFIISYNSFVKRMLELGSNWNFEESDFPDLNGQPFAKTALKIFNKSQVMTGFGSAVGKLIDFNAIVSTKDLNKIIDDIQSEDVTDALNLLIIKLDKIRTTAKKIGNDQRMFFHFFFRELLDPKSDSFKNLNNAVFEGYKQYERKTN